MFSALRREKCSEEKLKLHKANCHKNSPLRIDMPTKTPFIKFENVERQLRVPIAIYADFESILKPIHGNNPSPDESYTRHYQLHEPMSFCVYVKTSFPCSGLPTEPYIYRGREGREDVAKHFVNYLIQLAQSIRVIYDRNEVMVFNDTDADSWRRAERCYLCENQFNNDKVHDHSHLTGEFRGAACNACNLKCRTLNFVPVLLHNLSGYDSHFIVRELGDDPGRIDVIPNTEEKYISFTKHVNGIKLRFLDSYRFMGASLESLVKNLPTGAFQETSKFYSTDQLSLITRKGVFPYDYVDSWQKLEETCLPPKISFNNKLTMSEVSDEDYSHAQKVWTEFNCRTLGEYSDQYLKTDVLLLTDVFETFRDLTMESYKLDPCHFFTTPGLTWDAMLKYTKVELELLQDYDMILFFEKGLRGGLCQVSHRFSEANNRYMPNYDPQSESSFIMYLDANNLYGHAMSRPLPYSGFKWVENPEDIVIDELVEDSDIGYVFEVDIDYPKELHQTHNDLPFLPEAIVPPGMKNGTVKLIPHLNSRSRYVVHYITLKQALHNGLILRKVHRGIQFKQSRWLEPYIRLNTELRKGAKNDFEKDFYKLLNNAVFGKTMENIRNRLNIELVNNPKRLEKLIAKTNFLDRTIYNENLAAVHMKREKILFNKPLYIGMTILDFSKETMYSFNYDVMLPRYGVERLKLMYMDTDSFIYLIKTLDVYQDMKSLMEHLDTSAYPPKHPLFSVKNKKVLGKFKDEVNGNIIRRFVGLRPKTYALDIGGTGGKEGEIKKVAKGVVRASLKHFVTFDNFTNVLFSGESLMTKMRTIISKRHVVSSVEQQKIALTAQDNKRIIQQDGINTRAYGYIG
jgi:DNA polymerase type B, organellar and viral/Recombination endonuclease VII